MNNQTFCVIRYKIESLIPGWAYVGNGQKSKKKTVKRNIRTLNSRMLCA